MIVANSTFCSKTFKVIVVGCLSHGRTNSMLLLSSQFTVWPAMVILSYTSVSSSVSSTDIYGQSGSNALKVANNPRGLFSFKWRSSTIRWCSRGVLKLRVKSPIRFLFMWTVGSMVEYARTYLCVCEGWCATLFKSKGLFVSRSCNTSCIWVLRGSFFWPTRGRFCCRCSWGGVGVSPSYFTKCETSYIERLYD